MKNTTSVRYSLGVLLAPFVCAGLLFMPGRLSADETIGGFWGEQYQRLTQKWLPHCIHELEKGGRGGQMENFIAAADVLAGRAPSVQTHLGFFADAFTYNTAEAMCLALEIKEDPFLRSKLNAWIPLFVGAQAPSGYIQTYHTIKKLPHFARGGEHEFYVMGYFIQLGVAHQRLTRGYDRRLFDAAIRCANHLDATFGPAPKRIQPHTHPTMGLALLQLADAVDYWDGPGRGTRYAELARFFLYHQTKDPQNKCPPRFNIEGLQGHEMREARGHAVCAAYFYSAIEGAARRCHDPALATAASSLFDSVVNYKYYITGGIGAHWRYEEFGDKYELPQNGYCESCAGCGLAFWCLERAASYPGDPQPFDVYERVIYNNVLGSLSADGTKFFYQNPMTDSRVRTPWHGCPCCIGNIPRTLLALKNNIVSTSPDGKTLYVNNYMDIETDDFKMTTAYPADGKVTFALKRGAYDRILARFPNRSESKLYKATPDVPHGYREVSGSWELPLPEQTVTAIPEVASCRDCTATQRGPIVYSWEGKRFKTKVPNYLRQNNGGTSRIWQPLLKGSRLHGRIGLHTCFTAAEFKDITVTDANGKLLWTGLPDPAACDRDPSGRWSRAGDILRQTNAAAFDTVLRFGDLSWGDYTFRCKARATSGKEGFIIHMRERANDYCIYANFAGWGKTLHAIETRGDYSFKTPMQIPCRGFETGRWYDLEVTCRGEKFTMKLDGKPLFDAVTVHED